MQRKTDGGRQSTADRPLATVPTKELLRGLMHESAALLRKEVELARTELQADARREMDAANRLGVGAICMLVFVNLLALETAVVLGFWLPAWVAVLVVAAVVLAIGTIAFAVGWNKRVKKPLELTQQSLQEDVRWAKERFA